MKKKETKADRIRRNENLNNLMEASYEIITLLCTRCNLSEEMDFFCAEEFYQNGWRATEKHTYCPTCAKKFKIK